MAKGVGQEIEQTYWTWSELASMMVGVLSLAGRFLRLATNDEFTIATWFSGLDVMNFGIISHNA